MWWIVNKHWLQGANLELINSHDVTPRPRDWRVNLQSLCSVPSLFLLPLSRHDGGVKAFDAGVTALAEDKQLHKGSEVVAHSRCTLRN